MSEVQTNLYDAQLELLRRQWSSINHAYLQFSENEPNGVLGWALVTYADEGRSDTHKRYKGCIAITDDNTYLQSILFNIAEILVVQESQLFVLHCTDKNMLSMIQDVASMLPNIVTISSDFPDMQDHLAYAQRCAVVASRGEGIVVGELSELQPIIVYTDASINSHGKIAGLGVALNCHDDRGILTYSDAIPLPVKGDILLGELHAIRKAISVSSVASKLAKTGRRAVHIFTDSQLSVKLLKLVAENGDRPQYASSQHWLLAEAILMRARSMDVDYTWVRGHNGNHLNEIADRLALSARRSEEMNISTEAKADIMENIRQDAQQPNKVLSLVS